MFKTVLCFLEMKLNWVLLLSLLLVLVCTISVSTASEVDTEVDESSEIEQELESESWGPRGPSTRTRSAFHSALHRIQPISGFKAHSPSNLAHAFVATQQVAPIQATIPESPEKRFQENAEYHRMLEQFVADQERGGAQSTYFPHAIAAAAGMPKYMPAFSSENGEIKAMWGNIGREETLAVMQIARRMYNDPATKEDLSLQFSYKGQCVPSRVLDVVNQDQFLTWLTHVPAMNALVLSFRGTANKGNAASDANYFKTACVLDGLECGQVHRGFYNLWNSHRLSIKATIDKFAQAHQIPLVYVAGHSLGGAVAQIAALDLAHSHADTKSQIMHVHLVTFGTPRTGDEKFSSMFNAFRPSPLTIQRFAQTHRVLGYDMPDAVTTVPLASMGFKHVGGDELTTYVACSTCKTNKRIVLHLHSAARYVETLRVLWGHLKLMPCGTHCPPIDDSDESTPEVPMLR